MKVWKKQTTQWILKGKRVATGTPKAKRTTIHSKRFYGTLRLADGKKRQTPLTEDKESSETLLRRLQTDEDSKRANGADRYYDERNRPIGELLASFAEYLTSKGNTPAYVSLTITRCRSLLTATRTKTYPDLDASRILKTLSEWRQRKVNPISIATSNHYLVSIKGFSRWLWQERKSPDDPLAGLRKQNAETDRKRIRRPLTPTELETITKVAQITPAYFRGDDWQFSPADRAMLYAIAAYTGLRASELASLRKSSFDFGLQTFTIEAASAKNRKRTTLPLHPTLAGRLQSFFKTIKRDELFPGSWAKRKRAGKILKRDLRYAGIANRDASGKVLDFHSLRYTFITSLAKAGVHPSKAQRLARHSTIALTMNVYTSLDIDDLRDAIGSLPSV
jgi:integrase